ncbi:MAG: hypothetical protein MUC73_02050 [Cyclobacteriaceae bacterium]|jgi:hypothetical protein|nr:hypothetical protein [Cyclobacteriaceae bacterium]
MTSQPNEDREIFFTLKFYRGKKNDSEHYTFPFKFELDFNYPFNSFSGSQALQKNNVSIKPGELKASMKEIFSKLDEFFQYVDEMAAGKVEGGKLITNDDYKRIAETLQALTRANNESGSVVTSINRISYSQFNPREFDLGTSLSLAGNGDPKPPRL